jgi:hypothetical protein
MSIHDLDKGRFLAKYGSPKHQEKLLTHPHDIVRAHLAKQGTDEHRDKLIHDPKPSVVAAALSGRNPKHLDDHMYSDNTTIRKAVAKYGTVEHHALMMHDRNPEVRASVGQHTPDTYITDKLAQDSDHYVRAAVASNPHTADRTIERLGEDEHPYVRRHASDEVQRRNPHAWHAETWGESAVHSFSNHQRLLSK